MNNYKKWVIKFFFFFFLSSFLIIIFNYWVDAFNLFKETKLHNNSNIIEDLENKYYISYDGVDSNRVENIIRPLISRMKKIDILSLGSSRIMLLHKELLNNEELKYYNFTNGTARLDHYAKIIGMFNMYNIKLPKYIILGIDPWVFDEQWNISDIKDLLKTNQRKSYKNYLQLFNFEYTKINFSTLKKRLKSTKKSKVDISFNRENMNNYFRSKNFKNLLIKENKNIILSPYGDLYYPISKKTINLQEVKAKINQCKQNNFNTKCVDYKKLNNFNELQFLINFLQNNGVKIAIFLAPFEHTFYKHIIENNNFLVHEKKIKEFFIKNNLPIIGSYNPQDLNLSSDYFSDSIHVSELGMKRIFSNNILNRILIKSENE